jgi:hypothetical protein
MTARRQFFRTILTGTGLGLIILGLGGRLAMYAIAVMTIGRGSFTLGGTLTVVFLGGVSGAAAGLILATARALLHRWFLATTVTYWLLLVALVLRGLRPLDELRLLWFAPLAVVFGILLQWRTWPGRQNSPLTQPAPHS